jgi:hypothetical protein
VTLEVTWTPMEGRVTVATTDWVTIWDGVVYPAGVAIVRVAEPTERPWKVAVLSVPPGLNTMEVETVPMPAAELEMATETGQPGPMVRLWWGWPRRWRDFRWWQ